jgi:hypothetical protein
MILIKTVRLNENDILDAIKLYLHEKGISAPEKVCNYQMTTGDSFKDNSIVVALMQEEVK